MQKSSRLYEETTMTTDKAIIEKLLKIAENQQKIITKLAQAITPAPAVPVSAPAALPKLIEADLKLAPLQGLLDNFVKTRNPAAVGKLKVDAGKVKGDGHASVSISFPRSLQGVFDQVSPVMQGALVQVPLQDVAGEQHRAKSAEVLDNPV
jgi:hypothetical protein